MERECNLVGLRQIDWEVDLPGELVLPEELRQLEVDGELAPIYRRLEARFEGIVTYPEFGYEDAEELRAGITQLRVKLPECVQIYNWNRLGYGLHYQMEAGEEVSFNRPDLVRYMDPALDGLNVYLSRARVLKDDPRLKARVTPRQEKLLEGLRQAYPGLITDDDASWLLWKKPFMPYGAEGSNYRVMLRADKYHLNKWLSDYDFTIVRVNPTPRKLGMFGLVKVEDVREE